MMVIEDLIDLQKKSGGKGTGLTSTDIMTVTIFELYRTKMHSLILERRVAQLEEAINGKHNGNFEESELETSQPKSGTDENDTPTVSRVSNGQGQDAQI